MEDKYVEIPIAFPQDGGEGETTAPVVPSFQKIEDAAAEVRSPGLHRYVKIRYVVEGKGPALILVHGLGASLAIWGENITPLSQGHTIYALDLPGHGKSEKPTQIDYGAPAGAHFLAGFMNTLGVGRATLIGNSAGGLITALCALTYPQRVERLVLVDSAGLGRQLPWFLRFSSVPFLGELLQTPNVLNAKNMIRSIFYDPRPVDRDVATELMQARNLPHAKRSVLKAIRSGVNLRGLRRNMLVLHRLKDVSMPLLIIWGQEDRIVPVSHAYRAAEVLRDCKVHVIPRCGHWPQMEKSGEFNPLVLQFLAGAFDEQREAV